MTSKADEKCIHFNGLINEECEKGINYRKAARPATDREIGGRGAVPSGFGIINRIPCRGSNNVPCEFYEEPSPEEIEARDNRIMAILAGIGQARRVIMDDVESRGKHEENCTGSVACPSCEGGTLNYSYAGAYNKHVHAACSTPGCLSWME